MRTALFAKRLVISLEVALTTKMEFFRMVVVASNVVTKLT
jgi:hypothetical protein